MAMEDGEHTGAKGECGIERSKRIGPNSSLAFVELRDDSVGKIWNIIRVSARGPINEFCIQRFRYDSNPINS